MGKEPKLELAIIIVGVLTLTIMACGLCAVLIYTKSTPPTPTYNAVETDKAREKNNR